MEKSKQIVSIVECSSPDLNGNRTYSCEFSPLTVASKKWLGIFKRKPVEVKIRLLTLKEISQRVSASIPSLASAISLETSKHSNERRLFFCQPNIVLGKERYILVISDEKYDRNNFLNSSLFIAMNKHFWKVAQKHDIVVVLGTDSSSIFVDGKPYSYDVVQKYISEYEDLYSAIKTCVDTKAEAIIDLRNNQSKKVVFFSDLHIADKTLVDNFGAIKEKSLVSMLERFVVGRGIPVVIPGDLFELWQTTFKNIEQAYSGEGSLLQALSKVKTLIVTGGNHDDEIVEKEDVNKWASSVLPNAKILQNVFITSNGFDAIVYHGDKQDPANNHTVFGHTVSKAAGVLEKSVKFLISPISGRSTLEADLMGILRGSVSTTASLVQNDIIRSLASFVTDLNVYLYWNSKALALIPDGEKRNLAIITGHTHRMIRHCDNNALQRVFRLFIEEFISRTDSNKGSKSSLVNKIDVKHINLGAGSGEALSTERSMSRTRWKKVARRMDRLDRSGKGYRDYVSTTGESVKKNGRQNSAWFYESKQGALSISYTTNNYCKASGKFDFSKEC
jgi:UDP-2,3-diacylglucosamine pyrophosphatase LpxH